MTDKRDIGPDNGRAPPYETPIDESRGDIPARSMTAPGKRPGASGRSSTPCPKTAP